MTVAAQKIKKWLIENEKSYAWLASATGSTRQAVYLWLDGSRIPKLETRKILKEMFDLGDDWV